MSLIKKACGATAFLVASASAVLAGDWAPAPSVDNGSTAGLVLLLAIGAVLILKGGAGASASETRKDKVADEE